jgi:hypothetical protein
MGWVEKYFAALYFQKKLYAGQTLPLPNFCPQKTPNDFNSITFFSNFNEVNEDRNGELTHWAVEVVLSGKNEVRNVGGFIRATEVVLLGKNEVEMRFCNGEDNGTETQHIVTQRNVTQRNVTQRNVTQGNVTQGNLTQRSHIGLGYAGLSALQHGAGIK